MNEQSEEWLKNLATDDHCMYFISVTRCYTFAVCLSKGQVWKSHVMKWLRFG